MQVNILRKHLAAAAVFAAESDVRYYLNYVLVEVASTEIRIVATNGATAGVCRSLSEQERMPDVAIPVASVKLALANKSEVLALEEKSGEWYIGGVRFAPLDRQYPDYRRIIPKGYSNEPAQYDVTLLQQFLKAGKALGVKSQPILRHNGDSGAQVQFYGRDDFVGVIMPLRVFTEKHPDNGLIQWGAERA